MHVAQGSKNSNILFPLIYLFSSCQEKEVYHLTGFEEMFFKGGGVYAAAEENKQTNKHKTNLKPFN